MPFTVKKVTTKLHFSFAGTMAGLKHILVIVVLAGLLCCRVSKGAPASTVAPVTLRHDEIGDCLWGTQIRKRCQDCAVFTKSSKAYRMCCFDDPGNSTESVRAYCERLLNYTV